MNTPEARSILREQLAGLRKRNRARLLELLSTQETLTLQGPSGAEYQLEFQAIWDDRPQGNLRVIAAIDDGGLRAISPLSECFIVTPTGGYVGE